jgi:hypothetical protein
MTHLFFSKYARLFLATSFGGLVIGVTGWLLLLFRQHFVEADPHVSWSVFVILLGGGIGAAGGFAGKMVTRELEKLKGPSLVVELAADLPEPGECDNSDATFRFPPRLGFLWIALGLVFLLIPFFGAAPGRTLSPWVYPFLFSLAAGIVATGIYYLKYSARIIDDSLVIRGLVTREYPTDSIASVTIAEERGSRLVKLKLKDGRGISLEGGLRNFDTLVRILRARVK